MAGEDAKITVGANASAVERAAAVAKTAWIQAANAMTSAMGSAAQAVISDLGNIALAQGKVNFSAQHGQVREFEASSARLAGAMGRDLESVRGNLERTGVAIGKRPGEVASWATEVGKLTHNFSGAADGMKGLAGLAAETGRSVDDYRGLAVELGTVGKVGGDTTHAIGVLAAQAKELGTTGGVAAFAGQIEGLSDTISHFAVSSEADFLKVTAAAGALTRGLSDAAAKRVQQSTFGSIASDPMGWSRYLGRDITDDNGQVKDPTKVLQEITEKIKRTYGKDSRRMLQLQFGSEAGAAMFKADWSKAAEASGLAPSAEPQKALDKYLGTDAGKRDVAGAELATASRELMGSATALGRAADAMQRYAAHNPITSTLVATALGAGATSFMSSLGTKIATMMGGKGEGGAVRGVWDLATKGTGIAGVLGKAGLVGAAGLAGYEAGKALDEATGASDWISGTGKHSRVKAGEDAADVERDRALAARVAKIRADNAAKRAARTAIGSGGMLDPSMLFGEPGAPAGGAPAGAPASDMRQLANEIVTALKDGMKVEVSNTSDTPITASVKGSQSSSAGYQGAVTDG